MLNLASKARPYIGAVVVTVGLLTAGGIYSATLMPSGVTPPPGGRVGPATLASQLVRQELEALDRGGPIQRLFNNPVVLVVLFVLCVCLLIWGLRAAVRASW